LFACVDSKWEGRFNAGDKFCNVFVNVGLRNCGICAENVRDKVAKGDHVETFSGVVEFCIIHIVDGCLELVACDYADNNVCVPHLALGKVGSPSGFMCRSSSGRIDGDLVPADGESSAMQFIFLGTIDATDPTVSCSFVLEYLLFENEKTSVGAFDVAYSLKQATKFVCEAVLPNGMVEFGFDEVAILSIASDVINDGTNKVD
jgi:hypothetical protein